MGSVDRNKGISSLKPNWWINFRITEELQVRHGLKSRTVRESGGETKRAADMLLKQRVREVKAGTWQPLSVGGARGLTLTQYAAQWNERRASAGVLGASSESQRMRDYVLPALGAKTLSEVSRDDVKSLVQSLRVTVSPKTQAVLAPRSVIRIYSDLHTLYADAVAEGQVAVSPCTLRERRGELPKNIDKDGKWRSRAVFTRAEAEQLLSDRRIPVQRRVLYALVFFGGMRIGEAVARRWSDYDEAEPLNRLIVATQHDDRALKSEGSTREVPVHPALAAMLATWRLGEFEKVYLRRPQSEDHIVPNRPRTQRTKDAQSPISRHTAWRNLQGDLKMLGLRPRRVHDSRRTFISLALGDGANDYLLKFVTHGRPNKSAFDSYATPPWAVLCEQVGKLKLTVRSSADNVRELRIRRG